MEQFKGTTLVGWYSSLFPSLLLLEKQIYARGLMPSFAEYKFANFIGRDIDNSRVKLDALSTEESIILTYVLTQIDL